MGDIEANCRRWIDEVWNKGREETIEELFDQDGIAIYPYALSGDVSIRGRDKFKKFFKLARNICSRMEVEISDMTSDGNKVIASFEMKASLHSDKTSGEKISEPVLVKGLCRFIFREGKIVEIWNNIDLSFSDAYSPLKLET